MDERVIDYKALAGELGHDIGLLLAGLDDIIGALDRVQKRGGLSKSAMLSLNDPCARARRARDHVSQRWLELSDLGTI